MQSFTYDALPARVVFGSGTSKTAVPDEIKRLGCSKALVLTTAFQKKEGEQLQHALGSLCVGLYANATMHTPMNVTHEALQVCTSLGADCVVALGGGSTTGLGKALALASGGALKQVVIPTTYAGSEATPIIGQTVDGAKTTQKTMTVLPNTIIYDVDLTFTLPASMTVTSAVNAAAHAVEALYSPESNPVIDLLALDGIARIARSLPILSADPKNREARSDLLYASWACGTCLGSVGMGLHHKLCHTLGGSFGLSHSETHTVVLPYAMAYNASHCAGVMERIANTLGLDNAPGAIYDLAKKHGGPTSLKELGFKQEDIEKAADIAVSKPYPNPAPLERERIVKLLQNAFEGARPAAVQA